MTKCRAGFANAENTMFCGPEAEGNIDSRGSTKLTLSPRSHSISILLYTNSQSNEKSKANFIRKYKKYPGHFLRLA